MLIASQTLNITPLRLPSGDNVANFTLPAIFQLIVGVTIIIWYGWGLSYRLRMARKFDIGLLEVDLPQWHENMFWPLILLLLLSYALTMYL